MRMPCRVDFIRNNDLVHASLDRTGSRVAFGMALVGESRGAHVHRRDRLGTRSSLFSWRPLRFLDVSFRKRFVNVSAFEGVFRRPFTKVSPFGAVVPASPLPSGVFFCANVSLPLYCSSSSGV